MAGLPPDHPITDHPITRAGNHTIYYHVLVQHACERCGNTVEDGVPFCPHCNAPQIRVAISRPATPPLPTGAPGEIQPRAESVPLAPRQESVAPRWQWTQALPAALLAGFLMVLGLVLPWASPVLLMTAAGGFAAALYHRRLGAPITPGLGARAGMLAGLLGFVVVAVVGTLEFVAGGGRLQRTLREAIEPQLARNPDPRAQQWIQSLLTPGGLAALVVFGMLLLLVVTLICAAAGGALGASLFGRKNGGDR